jgi:hypothetical protein
VHAAAAAAFARHLAVGAGARRNVVDERGAAMEDGGGIRHYERTVRGGGGDGGGGGGAGGRQLVSCGGVITAWRREKKQEEEEGEEKEEDLSDPFHSVALSVTEQMAAVNAAVEAHLTRRRLIGPASRRTLTIGPEGGRTLHVSTPGGGGPITDAAGASIVVVKSSPERWVSGGYCEHHYVTKPPGPHGVYYEVVLLTADREDDALRTPCNTSTTGTVDDTMGFHHEQTVTGGEGIINGGAAIGFIALSAYGMDGSSEAIFGGGGKMLTAAQVDRLCVLPGRRGVGVKEALLRTADGFHALGLPVRIKTAKVRAVHI